MGSLMNVGRVAACAVPLALGACATIISKSTQNVGFSSHPAGAAVTVTNRAGAVVHTGTTPFTVRLKRGAGYFRSASYQAQFSKSGFEPHRLDPRELDVTLVPLKAALPPDEESLTIVSTAEPRSENPERFHQRAAD